MSDSEDNEEQAPLQQAAESDESRRAPAVEMNVSAFLSPIQPFLATPGDPPLPWKIWKQQFSTYLLATGLTTAPKEQQLAILLHSLGTEGQRIFATLPGTGRRPMRISRWSDRLAQYTYKTEFRPGKSNNVADTLSRLVPQDDVTEKSYFDEEEDELFIQQTFIDELQAAITPEELARETLQDPVLKEVLCYMKTGWEGPPRDILLSPFYMVREELFSWNTSCIGRGDRTIVPATLRHRVLTQAHVGHPGTRKMKQFLRSKVWWPKMDDDVTTFVNNCVPCALSEKSSLNMADTPSSCRMEPSGIPEDCFVPSSLLEKNWMLRCSFPNNLTMIQVNSQTSKIRDRRFPMGMCQKQEHQRSHDQLVKEDYPLDSMTLS
ncbi:hypothetical protein AAFF_G00364450 [Aldrovandia affinis]|uniref:Gypsy retrotransposon integrase-like protein 1 n=1 Tax=Aldrovandia affinis TaxID=143900 RepID=A0AAD7SHT5_9TELE|nr:hypothetical protein AAFF_G00364450 [Aldrovandia affinis]